MGLSSFVKGEFVEIIEWVDGTRDTLCFRFPDEDKAIKRGAQLIVRESQAAQFVYLGEFGDTFGPGKHRLVTDNLPVLTRLESWKYGMESPFKADVYFINTRLFTGHKWGTRNPIMMRDEDLGVLRARAFGSYDFRIAEPRLFLREVAGSDHDFRLAEFEETMRARLVSVFSNALAASRIPLIDAAQRYTELGQALLPLINPPMQSLYGVEITSFVIENISVPPEVEEAIDKRSSMAALGNLDDYVKFQLGRGLDAPGGSGGVAAELALGLALAQRMAPSPCGAPATDASALPELLSPADAARALGVSQADVLSIIESGELPAKKIGASWRIKRATLDAYLAG